MDEQNNNTGIKMGVLEWVLCILLVSVVLVTFGQVLFRYVFRWSLAWSEELARYLFMWLAALGAAYAFKTKAHFALMFMVDKLSAKRRMAVSTVVAALMVIFFIVFIPVAIQYVLTVKGQIGPGTGLSKAVPTSSAVVGGVLMVYYIVRNWLNELRSYRASESGEGKSA